MKKILFAALLCTAIASCKKDDTITSTCVTDFTRGAITTDWSYGLAMNGDLLIDTVQRTFHQRSCKGMLSCRSRTTTEEPIPADLATNPAYVLRSAGGLTAFMVQANLADFDMDKTMLKVSWFQGQLSFVLVPVEKTSAGWKIDNTEYVYSSGPGIANLHDATGNIYLLGQGFCRQANGTVFTLMVRR